MTAKGEATRQRIVAGAAAQIRDEGLATATLDQIRARTATSKSQLFHYFPGGKEELLLAVAAYEAERVLTDQEPQLLDLTSWTAWQEWRDLVVERYRALGPNCPMSALMTQVRHTPGAGAIVRTLLSQWQEHLRRGIATMQANGAIRPELDPDQAAASFIAGIQGGVSVLMSTGSADHLEAVLDLLISHLRGASLTNAGR